MSLKIADFTSMTLKLASPEEILEWSYGEVTKSETINYRTQRPEKDGLFCEKIFGPEKDWECYCGKYKRIRYKGIVCDKCGVEVTRSIVRRERMGHIQLAAPVGHIWFLRGVPSKIGTLLDIPLNQLEKVNYFSAYIITHINEDLRAKSLEELERDYKNKSKAEKDADKKEALKNAFTKAKDELKSLRVQQVLSESEYYDMSLKYGEIFKAGIGAEAVKSIIDSLDLNKLKDELTKEAEHAQAAAKVKILKRLKLAEGLIRAKINPSWMFITVLPVMPPDLRPMVQLDGGRFASSDLNDLYRRIINRNNRLKKLIELKAPEVIVRNEKRMLQESVDALIDNSARKGQAVMAATGQKRQLRSLADMLRGKTGRFRQNLLGKRVDYSGRSVIVAGPELNLDECGLPKKMALELFKPFVINKIIERGIAHNIRGAGHLIEEATDEVWAILEEVIENKYVLLNRAPTLHRLGIQAFKPILIEGMAIRIHPLVCAAFNADFDGDQMAVHLPLTEEAQKEAAELILSSKNLLKPANGEPIVNPTKDIVLGCYYLTAIREDALGEGRVFSSKNEAVLTYQLSQIDLNAKIKVHIRPEERAGSDEKYLETSVGRIIFNWALGGLKYINKELNNKDLALLTDDVIDHFGFAAATKMLDTMKTLGFEYASKSGISWGMDDLVVPGQKNEIIGKSEKEVAKINEQYQQGLLTNRERYTKVVEIWNRAKQEVAKKVPESMDKHGSVYSIVRSKARGSESQLVQMSGMKGPVVNPSGEIIELPIKKSYKEGLGILEYFISTHGARKGTADTALRTASAGYLTRKLVDVAQDVIVREDDCKDTKGITIVREDAKAIAQNFTPKVFGRYALEDVVHEGKTLVEAGSLITKDISRLIDEKGVESVKVRSVLTCRTDVGICQKCYGYDLGTNVPVRMGSPVGVVAAQAIGEPGTQLTMRTFHVGGVASGGDITMGLPRVEEIFEARSPKRKAAVSETDGVVTDISDDGKVKTITVGVSNDPVMSSSDPEKDKSKEKEKSDKHKIETKEYQVPSFTSLFVAVGDKVKKGMQLCEGHLDLEELLKVTSIRDVERYVVSEVQKIYISEGVNISDKHIEVIVKKMFSRVRVKDAGDTQLIPGDVIEKETFKLANKAVPEGGKKAAGSQLLLGITRVALSTESFLSAASFQETTRVLINAAIAGKEDRLKGLKENVIIGKLIPAGTGYKAL
ncbi:MAG TPA: DNA-directed RNA polymerase subunit beta' [Candidatus Paceibacterota bacterium]